MLPRMPHAVIFDMDGVLIDSETLYRDSLILAGEESGHPMTADSYQHMCGSTWAVITEIILRDYGADFPIESFRAAWLKHLGILMAQGVPLKPGVIGILDTLDTLGLPRAIATSSNHDAVARHLGPYELPQRFDHILARGDYPTPKPSPAPYLTAAERLGIAPHLCLALEDSYHGVQSAAAAGMMTVMVPDILAPTETMRALCVAIASDLNEVGQWLRDVSNGAASPAAISRPA
jgi:HAD superfamily hydrolase (TIGR01509 family)